MEKSIINSLLNIKEKYQDLKSQLNLPEIIADIKKYTKLSKEINSISEIVETFDEFLNLEENIKSSKRASWYRNWRWSYYASQGRNLSSSK